MQFFTRFAHTAGGILAHSSTQIFSSGQVSGLLLRNTEFELRPKIGFRSGDWLGHARTLICFLQSHSLVILAVCFGSLSASTHLQCFNWGKEVVPQNLPIHGHSYPLLNIVQLPCPMCRKTPPKHDATTPMLHSRDSVLGMVLIILLHPNRVTGIMTKILFWSHLTTWLSPMTPLHHPNGHWQT